MDDSKAPLIEVDRLVKHFRLRNSEAVVQAVDDISFRIQKGEALGLVGESGSGKTTVGRCLLRLVEPTSGQIRYKGVAISTLPLSQFRTYRAKLQIVFQNPFDSLNPRWNVGRAISEPLVLHTDLNRHAREARVLELMRLVGLERDTLHLRPAHLSAGQQQRVGIARALATNPEFIVLDEPTSALSPAAQADIMGLLIELQQKLELSYLFISHDLSLVKLLCQRLAIMYLGQIVEIGSKEQIFNQPQHPYSRALLSSVLLPDPAERRVDRQVTDALEGEIPSPINLPGGCYLYSRCPMAIDKCRQMPQALLTLTDGRQVRCWRVTDGDLPPELFEPLEEAKSDG